MIFLTNFSSRLPLLLLLSCLSGCLTQGEDADGRKRMLSGTPAPLVAVLPFENLSGAPAPLADLRMALIEQMRQRGFRVPDESALEAFMERHRLRYTGGITQPTAAAMRDELGVTGILITSLELYIGENPPRMAMTSRVVSAAEPPVILWMESTSRAGNEAPGLLGLGLVEKMEELAGLVFARHADSLAGYFSGLEEQPPGGRTFRPDIHYRAPQFDPEAAYRVAVLPFVNQSGSRHAGELMALHFVRQLHASANFRVIEPGLVREELMRLRVIIPEGASLDTAHLLFGRIEADLLLSGKVMEYDDYRGAEGVPRVYFTVQVIERHSNEVVWSSQSSSGGDEGVLLFDFGRIHSASELASRLARETVKLLAAPAVASPAQQKAFR